VDSRLSNDLNRVRRRITASDAFVKFKWGLAAVCGVLLAAGTTDFLLNLDKNARLAAWAPLVMLGLATLWLVRSALARPYTHEGIAATLERTFPDLDNRLINFLQFSKDPGKDRFKAAYLGKGAPDIKSLDLRNLADRKAHKRSFLTLAIIAALLALPGAFYGKTWFLAVWRTLNPFSPVELPTLTKIIAVSPGNSSIAPGASALVTCTVNGFKGHEVLLDLDAADGPDETISLGLITGGAEEKFSRQLQPATTAVRYRIRAGDARPGEWFAIDIKAPPSFTRITAEIISPAHTRLPARTIDLQKEPLAAFEGSKIKLSIESNADLSETSLSGAVGETAPFTSSDQPRTWTVESTLTQGTVLNLSAIAPDGSKIEESIPATIQPDEPPDIQILAPEGTGILPPGARPQIHFEITDTFGLTTIEVQQLTEPENPQSAANIVKSWDIGGRQAFNQIWNADATAVAGKKLAYRIRALDNNPAKPGEQLSSVVVFQTPTQEELLQKQQDLENSAAAGLDELLDLQKSVHARTLDLQAKAKKSKPDEWNETASNQEKARAILRSLIDNPLKPLGALTQTAQKLYVNESSQSVEALKAAANSSGPERDSHATEAVTRQADILRQLAPAEETMQDAQKESRLTGLAAILDELVKTQKDLLEKTDALIASSGKASDNLIDSQDELSENVTAFIRAARDAATQAATSDAGFSNSLTSIASRAEEMNIKNTMVFAAEKLEKNALAEAKTLQETALKNLDSLRASLNQVAATEKEEKSTELIEAISAAKEKVQKVMDLQQKMREAIDAVKAQANHDTKEVDQMEEEYKELVRATGEALLEIPTDLHIFAEMNTSNDLVEDVFSVFQEVEQILEEETAAAADSNEPITSKEKGYAKEDPLMEAMGEAKERLDACEMWLGDKADSESITTEAIDREEMPDSGIAMAELATSAEDLVGDLLQESKEAAEAADDGATNHAMSDFPAGWETKEGNIASFGAQGKSGNTAPDHKEQDGRSNVGRQGMASGETAAGSGTIGKGDDNIQNRRGQDPLQSGKVDAEGDAKTAATGGGKLASGKADDVGMAGGTKRMDSTEQGSMEGMAALAAKADALYAEASLKNVRVDSLKEAAHHIRQSGDAVAKGNISQMREFRQMAAKELMRASAQLRAGPNQAIEVNRTIDMLDGVVESGSDAAPAEYREKVSEYFKALNESI